MYLADEKPGRVLDVGCGNGERLARLRDLGWSVFGQDVDPRAVTVARDTFGLDVRLGPLDEVGFQEESFDFVILNHVIEHVHDPIKLLVGCRRLLKQGGRLILATPNAKSLGHKWFGANWMGLDPPRHVLIFSLDTLLIVAKRSGMSVRRAWTTSVNGHAFSDSSLLIGYNGYPHSFWFSLFRRLYRTFYLYYSNAIRVVEPTSGEECILELER